MTSSGKENNRWEQEQQALAVKQLVAEVKALSKDSTTDLILEEVHDLMDRIMYTSIEIIPNTLAHLPAKVASSMIATIAAKLMHCGFDFPSQVTV